MKFNIINHENCEEITLETEIILIDDIKELTDKIQNSLTLKKNIILNFKNIQSADSSIATVLNTLQKSFADSQCSFVVCELNATIRKLFSTSNDDSQLQIAPQLIEAIEIINMEIIERELLSDFENDIE